MLLQGKIFRHEVDGKDFYFPYRNLNEPQQRFISTMFRCLDEKKNLLIESPTGTGKTLSLLVGALSWIDQHYNNT